MLAEERPSAPRARFEPAAGALIPINRRLVFRGLFGFGAALAAPAIVRADRLPPEWEALAAFFDNGGPEGRIAVEKAHRFGFSRDRLMEINMRTAATEHGGPALIIHSRTGTPEEGNLPGAYVIAPEGRPWRWAGCPIPERFGAPAARAG